MKSKLDETATIRGVRAIRYAVLAALAMLLVVPNAMALGQSQKGNGVMTVTVTVENEGMTKHTASFTFKPLDYPGDVTNEMIDQQVKERYKDFNELGRALATLYVTEALYKARDDMASAYLFAVNAKESQSQSKYLTSTKLFSSTTFTSGGAVSP